MHPTDTAARPQFEPVAALPYLTADLPGLGGRIKVQLEDFVVEEMPLYLPSGEGEHLYLWIEKRDVSGEQLLDRLARALGVSRGEIGMAGLKDRRAVTRQYVSVPRTAEPRVAGVDGDGVRVLNARAHRNKLRTGHLAGNRFEILIRDADPTATASLPTLIARLTAQGFPNYYGEQRFGHDGETLALGLALLRGERTERSIPPRRRRFLLRLALSAAQSQLFNQVLAERVTAGDLHTVQVGDVMQVVASGGCFEAEDAAREQSRLEAREIVPTGPMFGPRLKPAAGQPGNLEQRVLAESGLTLEHFCRFAKLVPGARRAMLVWPAELSGAVEPDGVRLRFRLEPGCYATSLLRDVMKCAASPGEEGDEPVEEPES